MPAVQRPLQKILLPAGDAIVNFAGLGVQGLVKVRGGFVRRLTVGGDLHPVIDLKLSVGQLLVSQSRRHGGSIHGIRRIAALAGHVAGIAVRRHCRRDGGLGGLRRGGTAVSAFTGGFFPQPVSPSRSMTAHRAAARYLILFFLIPRFLSSVGAPKIWKSSPERLLFSGRAAPPSDAFNLPRRSERLCTFP